MRPARFVFTIIYLLGVVLSPALVRAQGLRFRDSGAPIDQRARFAAQEEMFAQGDEEANHTDEDFLQALEIGMPLSLIHTPSPRD